MKRLLLLFAALLITQLAPAEDWNKTFTLTGKPDLHVQTTDAAVTVDTWEQNKIEAHVHVEGYQIGPRGIDIYDHQTGNSVVLEVRFPRHDFHIGWTRTRVEISVHMPRAGNVDLKTGDGSIRLAGLKGEMNVASGDGSQNINDVDGVLHAHAGDGAVRASGRFDGLTIGTGDGSIEATARAGSTMANAWDIHAGDGSVRLRIPEKLAANVDFETHDGSLSVDMPVTVSGRVRDNTMRGTMNGGGNLLSVRTGDGSIRVARS